MQHKAKLYIIIVGLDPQDGTRHILSMNKDRFEVPVQDVNEDDNIEHLVLSTCKYFVSLDPEWVNPKCSYSMMGEVYGELDLHIFYHCIIPLDTKLLHNAAFVPVVMLDTERDESILKTLQEND